MPGVLRVLVWVGGGGHREMSVTIWYNYQNQGYDISQTGVKDESRHYQVAGSEGLPVFSVFTNSGFQCSFAPDGRHFLNHIRTAHRKYYYYSLRSNTFKYYHEQAMSTLTHTFDNINLNKVLANLVFINQQKRKKTQIDHLGIRQ